MNSFRFLALHADEFAPLFDLDEPELAGRGMRRLRADAHRGFPCRVSLEDAEEGEEVLLSTFSHPGPGSPVRATGPISVRRSALPPPSIVGEIPNDLRQRLLSLCGYDAAGMTRTATGCQGAALEDGVRGRLARPEVVDLPVHHAATGRDLCRVERA